MQARASGVPIPAVFDRAVAYLAGLVDQDHEAGGARLALVHPDRMAAFPKSWREKPRCPLNGRGEKCPISRLRWLYSIWHGSC